MELSGTLQQIAAHQPRVAQPALHDVDIVLGVADAAADDQAEEHRSGKSR